VRWLGSQGNSVSRRGRGLHSIGLTVLTLKQHDHKSSRYEARIIAHCRLIRLITCCHQREHHNRYHNNPNSDQHERWIFAKHSRHWLPRVDVYLSLILILIVARCRVVDMEDAPKARFPTGPQPGLDPLLCCGRVLEVVFCWVAGESWVCELISEMLRQSTDKSLSSGLSTNPLRQLIIIHSSTVAHGHQANNSCFLMNSIDDAKPTNAILA